MPPTEQPAAAGAGVSAIERPVPWYRTPWPWAFLAGIVLLTAMRPLLRREPPPPPVLFDLPRFELVSAEGSSFGSAELDGQVWIAHFFFTRCVSICPRLVESIATLRARFDAAGLEEVRLVGFTVDPTNDSPERLADYAGARGMDPSRWTLLTGDETTLRQLLIEGFRVPMGEAVSVDGGIVDIAHTGKLVLVDRRGSIRGYYDTDALGLDEAFHRAKYLIEHPR